MKICTYFAPTSATTKRKECIRPTVKYMCRLCMVSWTADFVKKRKTKHFWTRESKTCWWFTLVYTTYILLTKPNTTGQFYFHSQLATERFVICFCIVRVYVPLCFVFLNLLCCNHKWDSFSSMHSRWSMLDQICHVLVRQCVFVLRNRQSSSIWLKRQDYPSP